jgi:spermidine synthase
LLATYLAGLAIGSALYSRVAERVRDGWSAFGVLVASAGVIALAQIAFVGPWLMTLQSTATSP